jgi:tRNA-splicing ligase RtcB
VRYHTREAARINCHHNYATEETHEGIGQVWVTRKGAIRARRGDMGVIPGSQDDLVEIVHEIHSELNLKGT